MAYRLRVRLKKPIVSRPEEATAEHDAIETEILDGLCQAEADQFRDDDRLGLGRNGTNKRNGNTAPLYKRVDDDALR